MDMHLSISLYSSLKLAMVESYTMEISKHYSRSGDPLPQTHSALPTHNSQKPSCSWAGSDTTFGTPNAFSQTLNSGLYQNPVCSPGQINHWYLADGQNGQGSPQSPCL